jgi:hypothetical protein
MTRLVAGMLGGILILAAAETPAPAPALVAGASVPLWSQAKAKGQPLATLGQGVRVVPAGPVKGALLRVSTTSPFEVTGWVKRADLGCRISADTPLSAKPKTDGGLPGDPVLRKGAMVKAIKTKGGWTQVEAAPYPVRIFKLPEVKKGETTSEIVYTGYIVGGWIPASACSTDEEAYYDTTPDEGELGSLKEETPVFPHKPGPGEPPDKLQPLPGKTLALCRWVELEPSEGWSRGYVDGPVRISGWVEKKAIGPLPNTNPLNMIFMKQLKDYEIVAETDLKTPDGKLITKLPGGTDVIKVGVDYEGCIVKTPPPIAVEGLVDCKSLRNLATVAEKVIDGTTKQPQVTFPERGPKVRKDAKGEDTPTKKKKKKP